MAYTGAEWNGDGSTTVTLASVALISGFGRVNFKETPTPRVVRNQQNTPYPKLTLASKKAVGTIELKQLDTTQAFPSITSMSQTLVVASDGCYFSGNVRVTEYDVEFDDDPEGCAKMNLTVETVDGAYTLAKSAA